MNATLVLILLLLAVPLQLFFNHYLDQSYTNTDGRMSKGPSSKAIKEAIKDGRVAVHSQEEEGNGLDDARKKAMDR